MLEVSRGGGTGRRTGLKILRWQHRTGSIPVLGIARDSGGFYFKEHPWLNWIEYLTTNQAVAGSNPAGCMFQKRKWIG